MAIFEYTLPSGSRYRLEAPAGTTQAVADQIFYTQIAAGSLVGYEPGQTLTSIETQLTKFELSRLDRGTAGVDTSPVLAINQGTDLNGIVVNFINQNQSGTSANASVLAALLSLPVPITFPVPPTFPPLTDTILVDPIDEADIVLIKGDDFPPAGVGANGIKALSEYQIQKLLAQIAKLVNQESDQISLQKGIGKYGFTAYQLEQAGYVKSGTSLKYFSQNNNNFVAIMNSPSVWTGRGGVYSLDDLLNDSLLQNQIQVELMQRGYNNLLANGIIVTTPTSTVSVSTGQVYTNTGLQSSQTLTTLGLLATDLRSLTPATRASLTSSPSLARLLNAASVNLSTIASGATSNSTNLADANFASASATLANQITGSVGALVANASKYGTQATALWARASNLQSLNLSSIKTNLTNLVPPTLGGLSSNLNILGKAGSFATNFANPLSGLNNVGSLLTAGGGIGGALTSQVTGLAGQLGNLGNLTNIGSLGNLFGGGGDLVSGTSVAAGFNNTVNRATVDAAFARVVGSLKVPLPVFQYPSLTALAPRLDILQAQNFLKNSSTGGGTFGQNVTI
jgi:hypothetical protein